MSNILTVFDKFTSFYFQNDSIECFHGFQSELIGNHKGKEVLEMLTALKKHLIYILNRS
jgi:hypothetical protein